MAHSANVKKRGGKGIKRPRPPEKQPSAPTARGKKGGKDAMSDASTGAKAQSPALHEKRDSKPQKLQGIPIRPSEQQRRDVEQLLAWQERSAKSYFVLGQRRTCT
jgi:hypothetical protein